MPRIYVNSVKAPPAQMQPPITTSPLPSPARKKQKTVPTSPQSPEISNSKSQPDESPEGILPKGLASPFNHDEVSATFQAERLCNRLGFAGFPKFKITESPELAGFFSGYPDLGMLALKLPPRIGRVENVFGRKAAREKIAEELLAPLRELASEYDKADEHYKAGLPPVEKKERAPDEPKSPVQLKATAATPEPA